MDMVCTDRLVLRPWDGADWDSYYSIVSCADTMKWLGGEYDKKYASLKFSNLLLVNSVGVEGKVAIQSHAGDLVGYVGITRREKMHPLGEHHEIGWCISKRYWGHGLAFEAASKILCLSSVDMVYAYSVKENIRSCRLIGRLGMVRCSHLDFEFKYFSDTRRKWNVWKHENHSKVL